MLGCVAYTSITKECFSAIILAKYLCFKIAVIYLAPGYYSNSRLLVPVSFTILALLTNSKQIENAMLPTNTFVACV